MFGKTSEMKIVNMLIMELIPADYNPRKISDKDMVSLKRSIEKLGVLEPAVINMHPDRKKVIISGHQRIQAAEQLGRTEYPCFQVEFNEKTEREANIRMNKNGGEWDFKLLENNFELEELKGFGFEKLKFATDPPVTHVQSKTITCPHCEKEIEMAKGKVIS